MRWPDGPPSDVQRRLRYALETLRSDPEHPAALADAAAALAELKHWPAATDLLERLVKLQPGDLALRARFADALMQVRRFTDARREWSVLTDWNPADGRAWFNLAVTHQALGHLADARRAWDRAIELSPGPAAWARRGEVLLDLNDWDAAAADFERARAAGPADSAAALNLALARWRGGRPEIARSVLDALLADEPCLVPALNRHAEMWWEEAGNAAAGASARRAAAEAAARYWQQSLACDEDQPTVRDRLSQCGAAAH